MVSEKHYFERKMEKPVPEEPGTPEYKEKYEPSAEFARPLFAADFSRPDGWIKEKTKGVNFDIVYGECPAKITKLITEAKDFDPMPNLRAWHLINDLELVSGEKKSKLSEILPAGWRVVFNHEALADDDEGAVCCESDKYIAINRAPVTPRFFVTLAHELGHMTVDRKMNWRQKIRTITMLRKYDSNIEKQKELSPKIADYVIEDERKAWAVALKILRPLIKAEIISREDLNKFMHNYALGSYSDYLQDYLDAGLLKRAD
jgi:hypothetical protein